MFTLGGGNGNGKSDVNGNFIEWVGYPFVTARVKAKANWGGVNIYMYRMMPLLLLLTPPSVNTCNDSVAVAVAQCERILTDLTNSKRKN